jgi:hypothetical protein
VLLRKPNVAKKACSVVTSAYGYATRCGIELDCLHNCIGCCIYEVQPLTVHRQDIFTVGRYRKEKNVHWKRHSYFTASYVDDTDLTWDRYQSLCRRVPGGEAAASYI